MTEVAFLTPQQLVDEARDLLKPGRERTAPILPVAAALLARLAIENAIDEIWAYKNLDMDTISMKAQLACLPDFIDPGQAAVLAEIWGTLSGAVHYREFDLGPTAMEVQSWIDAIDLPNISS